VSSAQPTDSPACFLFRVGGEVAKKRGDDGGDDSHIVEAQDPVQRGRLRNRIRDQTQHAHLLLETLASLEELGTTPARSKTIKRNSTGSFPRQTK
jgi:Cdc6-like AAA superfamily ATPase